MHLMTRENLDELLNDDGKTCVSIFMPTIKGSESQETKQNPIRFRKLLNEAEKKLWAAGNKLAADGRP